MIPLRADLKALTKSHPVPSDDKLARHMGRLERMSRFYSEKAPEAPEKQGQMFTGFTAALVYSISIIKMYRKLTEKLATMADHDDTITK